MMKLIYSHIYYCLPPFLPHIPPAAYRSAPLHTVPNASAKGPSSGTTQPGGGFLFYRHPLHQIDRLHQAQHLAPLGVSWATLGTAVPLASRAVSQCKGFAVGTVLPVWR
jgi:hypothetical protein